MCAALIVLYAEEIQQRGVSGLFQVFYWRGLDIATRMGTEVVYWPRRSIRKKGILGNSISLRCSDPMWDGKHLLRVKCEQYHHDRSQWRLAFYFGYDNVAYPRLLGTEHAYFSNTMYRSDLFTEVSNCFHMIYQGFMDSFRLEPLTFTQIFIEKCKDRHNLHHYWTSPNWNRTYQTCVINLWPSIHPIPRCSWHSEHILCGVVHIVIASPTPT